VWTTTQAAGNGFLSPLPRLLSLLMPAVTLMTSSTPPTPPAAAPGAVASPPPTRAAAAPSVASCGASTPHPMSVAAAPAGTSVLIPPPRPIGVAAVNVASPGRTVTPSPGQAADTATARPGAAVGVANGTFSRKRSHVPAPAGEDEVRRARKRSLGTNELAAQLSFHRDDLVQPLKQRQSLARLRLTVARETVELLKGPMDAAREAALVAERDVAAFERAVDALSSVGRRVVDVDDDSPHPRARTPGSRSHRMRTT